MLDPNRLGPGDSVLLPVENRLLDPRAPMLPNALFFVSAAATGAFSLAKVVPGVTPEDFAEMLSAFCTDAPEEAEDAFALGLTLPSPSGVSVTEAGAFVGIGGKGDGAFVVVPLEDSAETPPAAGRVGEPV